jgi:hypothetical protein
MTISMSDKVLMRIMDLAAHGYDVRFSYFYGNEVQLRVSKNGVNAAHILTKDEMEQAKFDMLLYCINRCVELIDA